MIILGLDPGLARTGFGVINTDKPDFFVRCGCLTTPAGLPLSTRLGELGHSLVTLIEEHKPDLASIEEVFFGNNAKTAISTAHARGALIYLLNKSGIPIRSFTPLQIKSRLTGFGRADKQQVQALIQSRLNLDQPPQPDDAADALAASLCAWDDQCRQTLPSHNQPTR